MSRSIRSFLAVAAILLPLCCFSVERQPNEAYAARRHALAAKAETGVVVVFAGIETEGPNDLYGFRQDDNFYYLTGLTDPGAAVLVASEQPAKGAYKGRPYTEILFLPAHNYVQEKWTGPKLGADTPGAQQQTGVARIEPLDRLRDEIVNLLPPSGGRVYANRNDGTTAAVDWLKRANTFGVGGGVADADRMIAELRVVKDQGEIELIRKASEASVAAHLAAIKAIKPGLNEHDISALMQYEFQKRGCERPAYAPIVGSGPNSTVLHYSAADAPIRDGDLIVMDVGGEYSMYATDITRTVPASGHFTDRQREIYNIVLGAHEAVLKAYQPGKYVIGRSADHASLYQVAYDYINSHGKDLHGQPLGQYFIHGLSHYVGLSVHDPGSNQEILKPGMVFTIEPGIYIPEEKLGVRIEDTYYVAPDGHLVRFSEGLPRTVEEIERTMAK